jgi:UDP-N-acetylmuramoyl-tripeptide--D-alanyl-D-alanine ligase
VARAVRGALIGADPDVTVGEVVTDSRTARAGDLFVALKGPRFDAHEFVADVLANGAAAVVNREKWAVLNSRRETDRTGGPVIEVADTLEALQELAHAVRRSVATRVIAITGSAGKTTTKETIADFLNGRVRVVKNKGNLNNHIGLPLSLMQLRTEPDVAGMDLGMNHAGEISTLVAIAEPDVRVWTNVGDAHIGYFASPDAIADAKAEILERADPSTLLICNADDERVMSRVRSFGGRLATFGTAADATVRATNIDDRGLDGMRAQVTTPAGSVEIATPLLGRGNLSNVLAAIAVALEFGVPLSEIASRARRLRAADRRSAVHHLAGNVTLIDDSYNSSPTALTRALDVLRHDRTGRRKLAVLGEMLELGSHSIGLHEECGRAAAAAGLALLFTVGTGPARAMAGAAVDAGMADNAVRYFESSQAAADAIVAELRDGDVVLVKGSRGIRTDVVADRIRAERA